MACQGEHRRHFDIIYLVSRTREHCTDTALSRSFQDMDAVGHSTDIISMFHVDCRTKIDCRQSIHSHCALFQAARTYDSITRTGFCYASRYNQSLLPVGIGTLTRISSLCLHAAHRALSRRKRSSRMGIFDEDFGKRLAFCVKT